MRALYERDLLDVFATTYVDHPDDPLSSTIKRVAQSVDPSYVRQLERRAFHDLPFSKIRTYPWWELLRIAADKFIGNLTITDRIWEWGEHRFDQWVTQQVHDGLDAVKVQEHAALATLKSARERRIPSFYRQASQHHTFFTEVYRQQGTEYPELDTDRGHLHDSPLSARRNARRDRELELADYVLVNSSFTKRTLTDAGTDPEKILVVPLGCPEVEPKPQAESDRVTFLNAGTQSLRKGLHLLYQAWEQLAPDADAAALQLIGKMTLPESLRQGLPGAVHIQGSIPHNDLMDRYCKASVFVLPSLADGFAMVVTEAMSRGLPVITTENTGAADLITHGENGFVLPANDVEALVHQMKWCIENKHRLPEIGRRAVETARGWQWSDHRRELAETMQEKIEEHKPERETDPVQG
ncbi:glycosyltransferase involved in cell wall biosynthesis [Salinibacter ruber]|nr:glycosyltransferase involved in cell wall biosynthesis [Salinibacter ruber]